MAKKNVSELEATLQKLREREVRLKEELAMERKAADARAKKERARKMFQLAEIFVQQIGEGVLDCPEEMEAFAERHSDELKRMIRDEEPTAQMMDDGMMFDNTMSDE